jgi:nicotinamide riboside transporter PnuC
VRRRRILNWGSVPEGPALEHPYRDSAIVHGVLAGIIVVVAWLTSGSVSNAVIVAAAYFIAATAWSWWRFHQRLRRQAARDVEER